MRQRDGGARVCVGQRRAALAVGVPAPHVQHSTREAVESLVHSRVVGTQVVRPAKAREGTGAACIRS
eukprot:6140056-Prymnesium_polylepis.1